MASRKLIDITGQRFGRPVGRSDGDNRMTDYIDRKILLLKLHELGGCDADADTWADGYDKAIDLVYDFVRGMPTADVDTVVRCWDCKHGEAIEDNLFLCHYRSELY